MCARFSMKIDTWIIVTNNFSLIHLGNCAFKKGSYWDKYAKFKFWKFESALYLAPSGKKMSLIVRLNNAVVPLLFLFDFIKLKMPNNIIFFQFQYLVRCLSVLSIEHSNLIHLFYPLLSMMSILYVTAINHLSRCHDE